VIHLQELVYRYGSLTAVDGLSLKIADGEAFGLLGPNGAGKSTTIALCTGLLRPAAGSVTFNGGGSPTDATVRSRCGVAPQALALYEELTAEENLRFFGRLYGLGGGKLKERTAAVLDFAGLTDRAGDRVGTYSGGMKRRLNLAVALIHEPEILFLDEPTAGVVAGIGPRILAASAAAHVEGFGFRKALHELF
jgi:ABC-2 type transport system ATP-binding protein